jgi:hypothetical protein
MMAAYVTWKKEHEQGQAGVFILTVAKIIECMAATVE